MFPPWGIFTRGNPVIIITKPAIVTHHAVFRATLACDLRDVGLWQEECRSLICGENYKW